MDQIGKSIPRIDGEAKVTGSAKFVNDYLFDGMLHAKIFRAPSPRGKIIKLDTEQAKQLPGVRGIFTAKDIPGKNIVPVVERDEPLLADKVFNFTGEAIAIIVADDPDTAEEAVSLIKLEYEPLPSVLAIEDALKPAAPKICDKEGNIFVHYNIRKGDFDKVYTDSFYKHEDTYRTGYQEHAYLETQGMIAVPEEDNSLTVYGSMQCPFYVQEGVAEVTGYPLSKVRVVHTTTGGAFGGKEDVPSIVAGFASVPALLLKKPVKMIFDRAEDIATMSKRHPALIKYKSGFDKDGRLTAINVEFYFNAGAYSTLSPIVLWRGLIHAMGPYRCDNVSVDAYAVATNTVPCGAFRGFGTPQVIFAAETQMDIASEALGLSPLEIRERNILKKGDLTGTNHKITESIGLEKTLKSAVKKIGWKKKFKNPSDRRGRKRKGIGISTLFYGVGLGAKGGMLRRAGAFVQVYRDGTVNVAVGTTEMGQGSNTVFTQIASELLGCVPEAIKILPIDTSRVPDSGPTVASRSTVLTGNAIKEAILKIKKNIIKAAAELVQCNAKDISIKNGKIYNGENETDYKFKDAVGFSFIHRDHLTSQGWFIAPETEWDEKTGLGNAYFIYSYVTNSAEVEVDMETGEVEVLNLVSAEDFGQPINPKM
ncbi:MAG: xanthine dehydrogenase family protein molybdopterin-binding subunit, partial [bacterium]|nr:xanthine dehydrogenase family protein molybdopterin-binding subunit [bacterium]